MTLTQITYFNAVCEFRNITKAANELFVSRSAVSRALKDLETELDLVLFQRSRTGMELTEDGERVREIFNDFNNAYIALKKDVNERQRSQKLPELRIGITTTTGSMFFPDFFKSFQAAYPEIRIRLSEYGVYDSITALTSGSVDFFITPHIYNEISFQDVIDKVQTYTSELMLCISPEHPLTAHASVTDLDVQSLDLIFLMTPPPVGELTENVMRQIVSGKRWEDYVLRTSQQQLIHKAVASGFAGAVLPVEIAEAWEDIRMIPFEPRKLFPVYVIWNKTIRPSQAHLAFQKYLREYWAKN